LKAGEMVYLHAHDGEYEDDDSEYEAEVAERAERSTDDVDEQIQRRPRLGQLEHSQLMMLMSRFNVGHDLASLNTRSCIKVVIADSNV